jgi:hypothetical protein
LPEADAGALDEELGFLRGGFFWEARRVVFFFAVGRFEFFGFDALGATVVVERGFGAAFLDGV